MMMIYRRESAFTNVTKQTFDTNLVHKGDYTPVQTSNTLRVLFKLALYIEGGGGDSCPRQENFFFSNVVFD